METLAAKLKKAEEAAKKAVSNLIFAEVEMPYAPQYAGGGCTRVNYCSCDCNHIGCPIFMG